MAQGKIHIATSGWHYKAWVGDYYPKDVKPTQWLPFYTKDFQTTEINSSFYRLPKPETVEAWVDKVPVNFKFSPKFSRFLTHMKKLKEPEEPFERFFSVFAPMKKKMGVILLQLPPMVAYHEEKARHVFELARHQYKGYRFAIEVRHDSWTCKESIKLMEKYNIAFTISQSGVGWPYGEYLTSKNIYVRFHGPKELFASPYPDEMLGQYAKKFKKWANAGHDIWAYFNNDWYAYAVDNAKTLKRMVGQL
jgi:uncharacterized protein YecE (DUF72 family)